MSESYFRVYRKILQSDVAESDELLGFFIRLLAIANWKAAKFKGQPVRPGQLILSDRRLADRLYGDSLQPPAKNTILRRLRALEELGVNGTGLSGSAKM